MYWPGTIAVASGTTGPDAESATGARPWVPPCTRDPDLFFAESPEDVETAKSLCRGCAVRLACLAGARERQEPWGVWGGELFLRGAIIPRKRPRGRPRKSDVAA